MLLKDKVIPLRPRMGNGTTRGQGSHSFPEQPRIEQWQVSQHLIHTIISNKVPKWIPRGSGALSERFNRNSNRLRSGTDVELRKSSDEVLSYPWDHWSSIALKLLGLSPNCLTFTPGSLLGDPEDRPLTQHNTAWNDHRTLLTHHYWDGYFATSGAKSSRRSRVLLWFRGLAAYSIAANRPVKQDYSQASGKQKWKNQRPFKRYCRVWF